MPRHDYLAAKALRDASSAVTNLADILGHDDDGRALRRALADLGHGQRDLADLREALAAASAALIALACDVNADASRRSHYSHAADALRALRLDPEADPNDEAALARRPRA